jgi:hypothetical protein
MTPQTNLVSQDIVPLPVQQAAYAQQLGTFLKAYRVSIFNVIAAIFALLVFWGAGIYFLGSGLFERADISAKVASLVFGMICLGAPIGAIYLDSGQNLSSVPQAIKRRIYLFQQGIVIDQAGQLQPFPWHQTAEFWEDVIRSRRSSHSIYTLRRLDGYQIKLNGMTKGIFELGSAMTQGITQALVPRAWQALQSGQTLTFAPFSINQQGMSNGHEWLSWSQIQEISREYGRVSVKKVGMSQTWGPALIPNCRVFTTIAADLRQQAGKQ